MTKQSGLDPARQIAAYTLLKRLSEIPLPATIAELHDIHRLRAYVAAKLVVADFVQATEPTSIDYVIVRSLTPEGHLAVASMPRPPRVVL